MDEVPGITILYTTGQFHVTTDTTQTNKSSYAEYLVLVLYCTHITCHGFKGNIQIELNNYEISPFEQLSSPNYHEVLNYLENCIRFVVSLDVEN